MHSHHGSSPAPRLDLPRALRHLALRPGDGEYENVRHTYVRRGLPGAVLRVRGSHDVAAAVTHAATAGIDLAIRSGGHGVSGRSTNDGGIVIDLSEMSDVRVLDPSTGLIRVAAGARWGEVSRVLAPYGLTVSSGDTGDVGVGGLATAGGIGLMARAHGLTIDHIKAVEMVLADASFVRSDEEHQSDLFWAVRGAGANFGVVTAFEFQAHRLGEVIEATTVYDASDTAGFLAHWGAAMENAPNEITSFLTLMPAGGRIIGRATTVHASADTHAASAALRPFLTLAPVMGHHTSLIPYDNLVTATRTPHQARQKLSVVRSALFDHLHEPLGSAIGAALATGHVLGQFRPGGLFSDNFPLLPVRRAR